MSAPQLFSAAAKSLTWTGGALFLGLFPAVIQWIAGIWDPKQTFDFSELVRNGLVVGLVMALVGAVFIDTILSDHVRFYGLSEKLLFIVMPSFVAVITSGSFMFLVTEGSKITDFSVASNFYKVMLSVSVIYCLLAKFSHFAIRTPERSA